MYSSLGGQRGDSTVVTGNECSSPCGKCVFHFSEQLGGGYLHFGGLAQRADLSCEQLTDACGYKAADAVVRLRHAALADDDTWLSAELLDDSWVIADKPTSL